MTETKKKHTTTADFIGTWKLIDYSFLHEDGTVEKPWGDHVVGYLIYSAEGYMSGNLSPAGRRHNVEKKDNTKTRRKRDYIAYAGPYTVEGDTVTHHVEVSLFPNWLGTAQLRYHERVGNKMILRTPPISSAHGAVAVPAYLAKSDKIRGLSSISCRCYTKNVKIALAQINPTIGDFTGNIEKIIAFTRDAAEGGADLVLFPELAVCGYPPADFLDKPSFIARSEEAIAELASATSELNIASIVGYVTHAPAGTGKRVMNSAALLKGGEIEFVQSKMLLPFYDVFDEQRYFAPAEKQHIVHFCGRRAALTICEDAWNDKNFWHKRLYGVDPVEELMREGGGDLILNISASPYWRGKRKTRREMLSAIARHHRAPVVMVNQVGGNDSLIFDGSSLAIAADGTVLAQAKSFEEDLVFCDFAARTGDVHHQTDNVDEAIYSALVLGTRDYVRKCGFSKVLISLSGGIDSALVAAIAVDALGKENVTCIGMPSPYSSKGSIDDSRHLAENLGIRFEIIPISDLFSGYGKALEPLFAGLKPDITEENIQSRIRGNLMMALSNKFNALVLTTGNKSEMSVGYCTLYGDMIGALAVIGDVVKTRVYDLCRFVNQNGERIPYAILEKPPSAELRPDQKDTDSLPPYEVLDPILEAYVERYETPEEIAAKQHVDLQLVRKVVKLVERSEYKRQQAAPVLKVTMKAFGPGRRFPIAVKVQV